MHKYLKRYNDTMMVKQVLKPRREEKRVSYTSVIRPSVLKAVRIKRAKDTVEIADILEAGIITMMDKGAMEIKHIIAAYRKQEDE